MPGQNIPLGKKMKKIVATLAVTIAVLLFIIFIFVEKNHEQPDEKNEDLSVPGMWQEKGDDGYLLSNGQCEGDEKLEITHLPMNYDDFAFILPYGMVVGNHVTPIDHQYFQPTDFFSSRDTYPVYAMADATIVDIQERVAPEGNEYRLVFSMSCKLFYYYDLVTSLAPEIRAEMSSQKVNIPIKAGQQIGWIGGRTLDFAVWDMDVELSGFAVPEHYEAEIWKSHTADPLDYYSPELKKKILEKYIRTVEPLSGKIDHDIDGKLIGNWFQEGTGFYAGGGIAEDYWKTHFSIAPDYLDPTSIVVSVGDFNGEPKQFGVKGNIPDPASIGKDSSQVKYELVQQDWIDADGNYWDRLNRTKGPKAKNQQKVLGTVLVQLLEDKKLKLETFPGKNESQVSGFTENAKIYVR